MAFLHDFAHFFRATLPILLVPPASLVWILILGLAAMHRHRRLGVVLMSLTSVLLYALSMPIVGGALIASLEERQPTPETVPEPGAIIVLGADGDRTPDPLVKAEPGPLSLQRLAGAAVIAREKKLPVLITGGKVGEDEPAVAVLMADLFTKAFGLPVEWRETQSENTCQNAEFSAAILRKAGISSAIVVTHAWHMPRAVLSFRQAGYPIVPAPLHADTTIVRGLRDFLPHTTAWVRSFYALHEWIGLVAYRLGGCPTAVSSSPSGPP